MKYVYFITICIVFVALYTLAFMYSMLSAVLLTTTIIASLIAFVQSGKNAQMKEINDRLRRYNQSKDEEVGRLSTQIQMLVTIIDKQKEQKDKEEKEVSDDTV